MRILAGLDRHSWRTEALSGVTLAAIAIPLNIGYAQIAGLPPTAGLYSLIVPAVLFALLASSRQLVASPDAAAAALVGSSLAGLAATGSASYVQLALAQALVGAVVFALCAVLKLGFLANFLSAPILVGFVGGLALDILLSQVAKMLGVKVNSGDEFLPRFGELVTGLGHLNVWSVCLSVGSVAVLVIGRRFRAIPWALVVLVLTTVVLIVFRLDDAGVAVLGEVPAGPPTLTWPQISWHQWVQVIPSAVALTLVAMAEGLLVARRYAEAHDYTDRANRDLWAFGAANLGSGLTGGFTVGSSASRTAAMDQSGSRTQLPSLIAAVLTLLVVCFGTALLQDIPSPAIGAIVAVAVVPLLGLRDFARLWRLRRFEFAVAAVCFLGVLLLGPIIGIAIAFVLSLVNVIRSAANPPADVLVPSGDPVDVFRAARDGSVSSAPGVVVLRFSGPLFFGNAQRFASAVRSVLAPDDQAVPVHALVLDCSAVTGIDTTAADVAGEALDWARANGVEVGFSRARAATRADLEHFDLVGGSRFFPSNRAAVAELGR
ncbi:high affinity sulfate transporter 1 [Curtobacterium sp. PhB42]|uniref:SulP family inorganic anion transporter n=1 Tax=unclassified Curtobacterium TaxID=257496 RepID=UPI0010EB5397|nr:MULTISPECIES: solute carrier family 23 protein [unclassified Curtobacterium]TCU45461.1 high affinity sulfate transporter 1 [Curtobacterium sp. PhB146]TCU85798.1 high affinity sulfate transporter 1 [Curtobacterium sp. PhB191]TDW53273.1 high affinity sulfate transporter 1 [Curtobacterium sp. PhB42]TDW57957.1 high affinity sulfate transporter 1 [Curtobacterium sp. PhB190]